MGMASADCRVPLELTYHSRHCMHHWKGFRVYTAAAMAVAGAGAADESHSPEPETRPTAAWPNDARKRKAVWRRSLSLDNGNYGETGRRSQQGWRLTRGAGTNTDPPRERHGAQTSGGKDPISGYPSPSVASSI